MKNKFLCFALILVVILSLFCITSFGADEPTENDQMLIPPGTYTWNDSVTPPPYLDSDPLKAILGGSDTVISIPTFSTTIEGMDIEISVSGPFQLFAGGYEISYALNDLYARNTVTLSIDGDITSFSCSQFQCYQNSSGWGLNIVDGINSNDSELVIPFGELSSSLGKTFVLETPISCDMEQYTWFMSNVTAPTSTETLDAGYYRLKLPIDIVDPSWIGSGNTVWYNMRGRVLTDDSNRAFSFYRLGIRYHSWETDADRVAGWGFDVLIADANHDDLEIYEVLYTTRDGGLFYGNFNDLVLDSFVGIALDGDYVVDTDFYELFNSLFEPYDYVYTGNPWYDIIDGVVDALKIDVFGSFSPWDILVTFIGIAVFIWLLKLLAGG